MLELSDVQAWIAACARVLHDHAEELSALDRAIGDGDHGTNMDRGFAVCARLAGQEEFATVETYLKKVGMTLVSTIGGASGPLYGTFFLRMAGPLGRVPTVSALQLGQALRAGVDGVVVRGKATAGDKTMYDALAPALAAYEDALASGADLDRCLTAMAAAAEEGRDATVPMIARKGRASYLGERSAGHLDPGAASAALILGAAAATLQRSP